MKVGGNELGRVGNDFNCFMSCEVKFMVAASVPFQANWPETGEELPDFGVAFWTREISLDKV